MMDRYDKVTDAICSLIPVSDEKNEDEGDIMELAPGKKQFFILYIINLFFLSILTKIF